MFDVSLNGLDSLLCLEQGIMPLSASEKHATVAFLEAREKRAEQLAWVLDRPVSLVSIPEDQLAVSLAFNRVLDAIEEYRKTLETFFSPTSENQACNFLQDCGYDRIPPIRQEQAELLCIIWNRYCLFLSLFNGMKAGDSESENELFT